MSETQKKPLRVLLVDVHPQSAVVQVADLEKNAASSQKYTLETPDTATTPNEALEKIKNAKPPYDVLITSNQMPQGSDMHGFGLIEAAREHQPNIKAIISTATPAPNLKKAGTKLGVPVIGKEHSAQLWQAVESAFRQKILISDERNMTSALKEIIEESAGEYNVHIAIEHTRTEMLEALRTGYYDAILADVSEQPIQNTRYSNGVGILNDITEASNNPNMAVIAMKPGPEINDTAFATVAARPDATLDKTDEKLSDKLWPTITTAITNKQRPGAGEAHKI